MAEAAINELEYPQQLIDHLKQLSHERNDICKMFAEWQFVDTEDSGAANSNCPCGQQGIRYRCHIENKITKMTTFVGTKCVEFFDDDMKEVLKLALGLISSGINGKYKGEGNRGKKRFEIRANTNLATKERHLKKL